ncbi:MAG TPA: hypothetical protein VJU61_14665 [Polyangiaceae bacterium]|nr:hypothetical protein [Polyangiaceae bacterium]
METRGWWHAALCGAVGGAVAFGAALFFREPEPARTALELVDVACGASATERRRILTEHVEGALEVALDNTGNSEFTWTQDEVVLQLAQLDALSPHCQLSLHDYSVRRDGDGSEWLEGDLDFSASQFGDLHAERRRVRAQFRRSGDQVRLARLLLGPVERRVPEARP